MKKITTLLLSVFSITALALAPVVVEAAPCDKPNSPACEASKGLKATNDQANPATLQDQLKIVVNVLLFVLGAIAVIMIVVGGIRYTTSNGDSSAITSAKNTILYSVIGLVVALLAYAIVNFVLNAFD